MIEFSSAPATLPDDTRVYAIGDVHGNLERLIDLHQQIAEDLAERPIARSVLVHLGDYIDRGPDSAEVIEWLRAGPPVPADLIVNLMGNHEYMMLSALTSADDGDGTLWLTNGGADSLLSWGVPRQLPRARWAERIPLGHLTFLRDLSVSHQEGPYMFVHAGIRPGVALNQQTREDLLWIREPFLSSATEHGAVVVHGHTPKHAPTVQRNRIGIDTGAVLGGDLTCVVLEGDRLAFIKG